MEFHRSLAIALGLALGIGGCTHSARGFRPNMGTEPSNVVIVTGVGEASAPPDIASISFAVQKRSHDVKLVVAEVSHSIRAVEAALLAAGVEPRDLQTSQLNVGLIELSPSHFPQGPQAPAPVRSETTPPKDIPMPHGKAKPAVVSPPPRPIQPPPVPLQPPMPMSPQDMHLALQSYEASIVVSVKIRQFDRAGDTVAAAIAAGANQTYGMNLTWENPRPLFDKARRAAVEDAQHRATELAQLDHLKLGRVLSVIEQSCGAPGFGFPSPSYGMSMAPMVSPVPGVPFERGPLTGTCVIRVAFVIEN